MKEAVFNIVWARSLLGDEDLKLIELEANIIDSRVSMFSLILKVDSVCYG